MAVTTQLDRTRIAELTAREEEKLNANTQASGRAVFSGVATGSVPLGPVEDMLAALQTAATGATTAGQVAAAVTGWFADPLGFGAFYQGGGPLSATPITQGEAAEVSTTATDPALRDTLAGFAMAAGLLTVIGWAMREAARVQAENEGFV